MASFALNAATGDLDFTGNRLQIVYDDDAIIQQIRTRLRLSLGEWFRDLSAGTDWIGSILGKHDDVTRRAELRSRIQGTPGVETVVRLEMSFDARTRKLSAAALVRLTSGRLEDVRFEDLTPGGI